MTLPNLSKETDVIEDVLLILFLSELFGTFGFG